MKYLFKICKYWGIVFVILFSQVVIARLHGIWSYDGYVYQNIRYPNPNPTLHVEFDFFSKELISLKWYRDGENSFCQRIATYDLKKQILQQNIIWVNPRNTIECASDPDMQLNKKTFNKLVQFKNEMHLYLELNGSDFIYILKKGK